MEGHYWMSALGGCFEGPSWRNILKRGSAKKAPPRRPLPGLALGLALGMDLGMGLTLGLALPMALALVGCEQDLPLPSSIAKNV